MLRMGQCEVLTHIGRPVWFSGDQCSVHLWRNAPEVRGKIVDERHWLQFYKRIGFDAAVWIGTCSGRKYALDGIAQILQILEARVSVLMWHRSDAHQLIPRLDQL